VRKLLLILVGTLAVIGVEMLIVQAVVSAAMAFQEPVAPVPPAPTRLRVVAEPQIDLSSPDKNGPVEAWDAKTRTLHVTPRADVHVCLPHTTGGEVHEDCFTSAEWGARAH